MAHTNKRAIQSSRFPNSRAVGFRSKPLSTTGNIPASAPVAPVSNLARVTTRVRPREEEESPGDFGRVSRSVGGFSPRVGQRRQLDQPGERGGPGGLGKVAEGFLKAGTAAPFPLNLASFAGLQASKAANRRSKEANARTPGENISTERLLAQPEVNKGLIQRTKGSNRFDQGDTGQGGASNREEESGGDFGRSGGDNPGSGRSSSDFGGGDFGFARGGLVTRISRPTQGYAHGGLVDGPGDGNDDGVTATPAGQTGGNVQFSDGEYVVPADVVSSLGDGDTESGAAILDQLIEAVRQRSAERLANTAPPIGAEERAGVAPVAPVATQPQAQPFPAGRQ